MMEHTMSTLPVLLNSLRKKIMEEQLKFIETYGLSKQHIPYIIVLWNQKEGLVQKKMIEQIHFDKAHASRALKELIDKNILIKEDKQTYKNKYFLSDLGLEIAQKMKSRNQVIIEDIFQVLTDEEKKQMKHILEKLTKNIQDSE
jgi:DNA-binding MarR family transcriptional regulator